MVSGFPVLAVHAQHLIAFRPLACTLEFHEQEVIKLCSATLPQFPFLVTIVIHVIDTQEQRLGFSTALASVPTVPGIYSFLESGITLSRIVCPFFSVDLLCFLRHPSHPLMVFGNRCSIYMIPILSAPFFMALHFAGFAFAAGFPEFRQRLADTASLTNLLIHFRFYSELHISTIETFKEHCNLGSGLSSPSRGQMFPEFTLFSLTHS